MEKYGYFFEEKKTEFVREMRMEDYDYRTVPPHTHQNSNYYSPWKLYMREKAILSTTLELNLVLIQLKNSYY